MYIYIYIYPVYKSTLKFPVVQEFSLPYPPSLPAAPWDPRRLPQGEMKVQRVESTAAVGCEP